MSRDIDWITARDHIIANAADPFNPTFDDLKRALRAVAPESGGTFGYRDPIEQAVMDGVLIRHGEGDDAIYSFDPDALATDIDEDTEETTDLPGPTDTGTTDLPEVLTRADDPDWPSFMTERDEWVLGVFGEKEPRAPWMGSGLYPAKWNSKLDPDDRPEIEFERVYDWVDRMNNAGLWNALPKPDDLERKETVPAYLLPPDKQSISGEYTLIFIDWDDVVLDDGIISPECREWLKKLNSVTEFSSSGTGLHTFVAVSEPLEMRQIEAELETEGEIEVYQTGRFASMTGDFVAELPNDVALADDVMAEIVDEYHQWSTTAAEAFGRLDDDDYDEYDNNDEDDWSKYYSVNPAKLLDNAHEVGSEIRGDHPAPDHDANSRHNKVAVDGQVWRCYHNDHQTGGNALHLAAVAEGYISCPDSGKGAFETLSDVEFAQMCMDARDNYDAFNAGWKPPYRAVLGTAKAFDLATESAERVDPEIYDIVRALYDEHSSDDL